MRGYYSIPIFIHRFDFERIFRFEVCEGCARKGSEETGSKPK